MSENRQGSTGMTLTTLKVRSAFDGDEEARAWIVLHFSPLLLAQAHYRMRPRLRRYYDPEDVVADTWQRALPRLGDFRQDDHRNTPRLVKFLATTLTYRVNELFRQWMGSPMGGMRSEDSSFVEGTSIAELQDDPDKGILKSLVTRDEVRHVLEVLEDLNHRDQEIIVLRKVEGLSSGDVAMRLDISPNAVDIRLSRALTRLRARLRESVFDELVENCD